VRAGEIEHRLRRLEGRGGCQACGLPPDGPGRIAVISEEHPEESFDGDPNERCERCGRFVYTVIRVVYDDTEGGGA
jgi:hypothetical protein